MPRNSKYANRSIHGHNATQGLNDTHLRRYHCREKAIRCAPPSATLIGIRMRASSSAGLRIKDNLYPVDMFSISKGLS